MRKPLKQPLTLLEVILVLVLLSVVGSVVGVRLSKALGEKKFHTSCQKLFLELETCHRLAGRMQADQDVVITSGEGKLSVRVFSPESGRSSSASWEADCILSWEGRSVDSLVLQFAASGAINPKGVLQLTQRNLVASLIVPLHFGYEQVEDDAFHRP